MTPVEDSGPSSTEAKRILVIEDNQATSDLVYEVLSQEGYAVLRAASGEAGMTMMEQERADLVLLDLMLPGIDGFEVCRRLKARWSDGEGQFLPVVMLTARGSNQDVVAGLEAGADEYLRKPFEIDELLLRVRAMLRIVANERALARRNRELEAAYSQERDTRRQLEALEAVTAVGLADLALEPMLQRLIDTMAQVAHADAGAIFLREADSNRLKVGAAVGMLRPSGKEPGDGVKAFVQRIAQSGQTTQLTRPAPKGELDGAGETRVLLGTRLAGRGGWLGVATLERATPPFSSEEMRLFEVMANRAALAIENAALNAQVEKDLEMKTLLLRELQHRVRNNLQAINGILSFQMSRDSTAQAAITGAMRRIKSIAATQDFLFKQEGGPIPMRPLLEVVAHQLATLWALPEQNLQVTADPPEVELSMERAQIVGLAVHELIANAFQHGLKSTPGVIRLHIQPRGDGVLFEVTDPGGSVPPDFDLNASSLAGLKLVQILLQREFRIKLHLDSEPGRTRAWFSIPLSYFPTLALHEVPVS